MRIRNKKRRIQTGKTNRSRFSRLRRQRLGFESLEDRRLLALGHVFEDINPDTSDHDALDPIGASGGRVNFLAGVPGDTQTFYAASEFGGLYKSTDGGQGWAHLDGHLPQVTWDVEVDPSNVSRVYATSFYDGRVNPISGIQISTDAGLTWSHPPASFPDPVLEGTPSDNTPQAAYFASTSRRQEPSAFGIAIRPDAPNEVYVGINAGLAISLDSGTTWRIVDPELGLPGDDGTARNVWDVVVQPAMPGFPVGIIDIIGDDGHLRSTDQGTTWTRPAATIVNAGTDGRDNDGDGNVDEAGETGTLPTGLSTIAVSPDESYVLFAAASDNDLYESDDAGATWTNLGTPDRRRQGRIPWVQANQRSDAGNNDVFDIWFGDVGLFRASCTSQAAVGGAARCPAASTTPGPAPPAPWAGTFTRAAGAHDDVGDVVFDPTAATDACPLIFSNDGGIYYNDDTDSPGCHSPGWEEPNPTPHALWLFGMTNVDVPGSDDNEDSYFGTQDNGFFASTDAGAASPSWHNTWGADSFDVAADDDTVLYNRGSFGTPGRAFRMFLGAQGAPGLDPAGTEINTYPAGGTLPLFLFTETVANFADDSYVMLTADCTNPSAGGGTNNGCPIVAGGGSDGGVFITTNIKANPIVWTELVGNTPVGTPDEPFNSANLAGVQVAVDAGTPTFYVQVGGGDGRSADQLWKFVGTNPNATWTRIDTNLPGSGIGVFGVDPNNSNRLYASADPTGTPGMFFSTDGGITWNPDGNLDMLMQGGGTFQYLNQRGPTRFFGFNGYPQPSLVAYDAEDPNNIVAGGQDSGVFLSTDAGQSWRLLTDPFGTEDDLSTPEDDVPNIPRPRYAHFDHEPAGETRIVLGTQGFGVRRIGVNFEKDPDQFEDPTNNDTIGTATILGSLPQITLNDLSIHNDTDVDFYKYTATDTGKLIINMFHDNLVGDLELRVRDANGNIIPMAGEFTDAPGLAIASNTTINAMQDVAGLGNAIEDVDVTININHTFDGDLDIFLVSPSGTRVELTTDNDGGNNFTNTTFDDDAPISITDVLATPPYTGQFQPEGLLASLIGEDPNGTWTLEVTDDAFLDAGTLIDWTLSINTQLNIAPQLASEQIVIPVVSQEEYFIEVFSELGHTNCYDLEIENFAAPVPSAVHLDPASDTGMMSDDNYTGDSTPRFLIQADLRDFANMGITILDAAQAIAGVTPGAAVKVVAVNSTTGDVIEGFADPVGTGNFLFEITPPAPIPDGVYFVSASVKIFDGQQPVSAMGETQLSEPLWVTIDAAGPTADNGFTFDMLDASDSGMSMDDYVTNIMTPAFDGVAEAGAKIRIFAAKIINNVVQPRELIGQGVVNSDSSDGVLGNGLGSFEVTVERLVDAVYDLTVDLEDAAGNVSTINVDLGVAGARDIEIDSLDPNLPFLDLVEADDTGRHNDDNVTNITLLRNPDFTMTSEDRTSNPADYAHLIAQNFKFRVFDRLEESTEVLIYDSATDATIPGKVDGLTELQLLQKRLSQVLNDPNGLALADGVHNLKLEVEDRAGNLSHDFLLDIEIDTLAPEKSFGDRLVANDGLHPESDSGVSGPGNEVTLVDRVTNDLTPTFWGRTEANAIVRAFVEDSTGSLVQIGQTVAAPLDGNDDHDPLGERGYWELTSTISMNDPLLGFTPIDGKRTIIITAEDQAGNFIEYNVQQPMPEMVLDIFIDTQGPRITDVEINNVGNPYDLFDPKPSEDGPTPPVHSLVISVEDLPLRSDMDPNFLYDALLQDIAEQTGHYRLVGDHNGVIPIKSVQVILSTAAAPPPQDDADDDVPPIDPIDPPIGDPLNDGRAEGEAPPPGELATATIVLMFYEPLPDDRFTLTISDSLVDPAGNQLDGENNAVEPQENPVFPTGDGVPGGDFVARFTIDTRAELGVWTDGSVFVDTNGNLVFDPENKDNDDTNEDITYVLGFGSDNIFAGNFAEDAADTADGFAKLAAYGQVAGAYRWLVDTDNNGVPNLIVTEPAGGGLPVAGNFDRLEPNGNANGDEVGLKTGNTWRFDTDHDFTVDTTLVSDLTGYPIVGDFDGDGVDDLGSWTDDTFRLDLSTILTGAADGPFHPNVNGVTDVQFHFGFPGPFERPISADFDGDGIDDIGLWVPKGDGATPDEVAEWYILISDGRPFTPRNVELEPSPPALPEAPNGRIEVDPADPTKNVVHFTPEPFGKDLFAQFGNESALPVVGNFDPPTTTGSSSSYQLASFTNPANRLDVNGDGFESPVDALILVNLLNSDGGGEIDQFASEALVAAPYYDTNRDYFITAADVLQVVNGLNGRLAAEGESTVESTLATLAEPAFEQFIAPGQSPLISGVQLVSSAPSQRVPPPTAAVPQTRLAQPPSDAFVSLQPTPESTADRSQRSVSDGAAIEDLLDVLAEDVGERWEGGWSPFDEF